MSWFSFDKDDDKIEDNDWYNKRSHQDSYSQKDVQYCRFCGVYTTFENDRCSHCYRN